jgi:predicted nucleic acid-binding protein
MTHHKNKSYVVDSCVFAKLFLQEKDRDAAVKFFENAALNNCTIYVPDLFIYEILNICTSKKLDEKKILNLLRKHKNCGLVVTSVSEKLILKAIEMTKLGNKKSGYPAFYDCLYHALAISSGCYFITSDKKHFAKTKALGSIKLLEESE